MNRFQWIVHVVDLVTQLKSFLRIEKLYITGILGIVYFEIYYRSLHVSMFESFTIIYKIYV